MFSVYLNDRLMLTINSLATARRYSSELKKKQTGKYCIQIYQNMYTINHYNLPPTGNEWMDDIDDFGKYPGLF